jgi:hypothetical protein
VKFLCGKCQTEYPTLKESERCQKLVIEKKPPIRRGDWVIHVNPSSIDNTFLLVKSKKDRKKMLNDYQEGLIPYQLFRITKIWLVPLKNLHVWMVELSNREEAFHSISLELKKIQIY